MKTITTDGVGSDVINKRARTREALRILKGRMTPEERQELEQRMPPTIGRLDRFLTSQGAIMVAVAYECAARLHPDYDARALNRQVREWGI